MPARRDDSPRREQPGSREESGTRASGTRASGDPESGNREESDDATSLWRDPLRQFAHYSTAGIMFPVAVALGFWLGWLLDERLGTFPWLSFVGLALGFAAATRNLLQTVASDTDDDGPDEAIDDGPDDGIDDGIENETHR